MIAWHVHHDRLSQELQEPLENRIQYIKAHKPASEVKLRLKLLKISPGLTSARAEYEEAKEAASAKLHEAQHAAWTEYEKAKEAAVAVYERMEKALHKVECPNCPWNGTTIFVGKQENEPRGAA